MEKKLGRPRSEETRKAILTAAYEMLVENGFKSITIEGISERAGVSKATIYKWWPNKAAVVLDGFFDATISMLEIPDTGSLREDLLIQISNLASFLTSPKGKVLLELIAEGQSDSNVAQEYRNRYFNPRRLISKTILEKAEARHELKNDLDLELIIDLLFAPLFYRLLITGDPVDSVFIERLISYVLVDAGHTNVIFL